MRPLVEFIRTGYYPEDWSIGDKGVIISHTRDAKGQSLAVVVLYKDGSIVTAPYYTIKVIDTAGL